MHARRDEEVIRHIAHSLVPVSLSSEPERLMSWRHPMRIITIALLTTLATLAPAQAQDARFHDAQGRVTVAYCEFRYG